jgi:prolipoprotein diacylglyceryl transferase
VIDRIVIVTALGGMFIRLGNLMNSEIFGVPTSLPWGFVFRLASDPAESVDPRHPTQLYEAFSYLLIFFFLLWVYYRMKGNPPRGLLLGLFLVLVFSVRIVIEFVKEPQVAFERTMVLNMGQWLSIPFVLAGLIFIILSLRKR